MELYEKIKALNSEQERNFEPYQRSSLVTDNWYDRKNNSLVSTNRFINSSRKDDWGLKVTERPIVITYKDNKKDFDERKDYSLVVQKIIEVEEEINSIEIIQKKKVGIIDEDKEKGMERQQSNSTLTNLKETLRKEIDIEKNIGKERNMIRKEKEDDSLEKTNNSPRNNDDSSKEMFERQNNEMIRRKLDTKEIERDSVVKVVNKERKDSSKKSNSFKEEIDERLKSIERTVDYTRDNSLVKLAKKIEILNLPIETKEIENDITVLEITELSENEISDRHVRNIICHKCKKYGHTKKQCDRHNKIVKQISKLEFEKDVINELMEMFNVKQEELEKVKKN